MQKSKSGFTLVELLIVIAVVGILAGITVVAYNGIQERARATSLLSDLTHALDETVLANLKTADKPASLSSSIKTSKGNVLQLTRTEGDGLCINGYGPNNKIASISSDNGSRDYLCSGALIGDPVGGVVPPVPKNTNLVSDFSTWQTSGGMTYNSSTKQLCGTTAGIAVSPLIRIDGATSATLRIEAYATQPSPNNTPNSAGYYGSRYFQVDGVTPATSSAGYQTNGNAQVLPMSAWTTHAWSPTAGSSVRYIQFTVNSSPTNYTSNNCYRNPRITI